MVERVRKEQAKASSRSSKAVSLSKSVYSSYKVVTLGDSSLAPSSAHRSSTAWSSAEDESSGAGPCPCPRRWGGGSPALLHESCRGRLRALQGVLLRGTFNPQSRFRASWDMTLLLAVMYITIVLPLQVGFEPDLGKAATDTLNQISAGLDIFFLLDIVINFRTGFYVEGAHAEALVRDPWLIASRYVKGWFSVDAIASPPFALLSLVQSNSGSDADTTHFAMFR